MCVRIVDVGGWLGRLTTEDFALLHSGFHEQDLRLALFRARNKRHDRLEGILAALPDGLFRIALMAVPATSSPLHPLPLSGHGWLLPFPVRFFARGG